MGRVLLTDEQIIDLYWDREERAIAETDVKYGQFLYRIAMNILADRCDSEECQNDTYLQTWNAIPPARPSMLRAFLAKITRNLSINRYKEKNAQKRVPSHMTVALDEVCLVAPEDGDAAALGLLINEYLRTLESNARYIFIERYYFAASVKDISIALQMTESNVYKQLAQLKCGLREYLSKGGVTVE